MDVDMKREATIYLIPKSRVITPREGGTTDSVSSCKENRCVQ